MSRCFHRLHKKFRKQRVHGEWFNLTEADVEEFKSHPLYQQQVPQ